jgi:chromatin assembly factor 1 subunit B
MIFAIGTNDSVFIYGTDSIQPRYAITNIHYQSITDLAWNGDKMLAISSSDGYISFVVFEENELGIAFKPEEINWDDDKFKKQYQLYFDVDIKKNVMSTQNIITDIKIKKKKNVNNNIEQEKNIEENREENTEKIKEEKMEVENP